MAKFKPARGGKKKETKARGLFSCVFLLLMGMFLFFFLFYSMLKSR